MKIFPTIFIVFLARSPITTAIHLDLGSDNGAWDGFHHHQNHLRRALRSDTNHHGPSFQEGVRGLQDTVVYNCTTLDCDALNPDPSTTIFTSCSESLGCQFEVCDDGNACTTNEAVGGDCVHNSIDCDDGNPLTIDTCDPDIGCQYECDDGNACTREAFVNGVCQPVDEYGDPDDECSPDDGCIPGLIDCDDGDGSSVDLCVPSTGCRHLRYSDYDDNQAELESILEELEEEGCIIYEDEISLTRDEVLKIIDWIKLEMTQLRTPFCWRRTYGRGWGEVITDCPSPKEKIGALCYSPCETGYSRQGTFDCQQECKPGWRDDGLFCRLPEYGRGVGYPWKIGDALNDSGMFSRCERDHGRGNCEKTGLIVYPKCRSGYSNIGCCICRPSFSSCPAEGYADFRIDLSCGVKIKMGDPTPLICGSGLELDGALCYPPCAGGYYGVGPVCWQECDVDQTNCGLGCATSDVDCGLVVADQVIAPLIVAANIATLGMSSIPASAAADAVQVGSKFYKCSSMSARAMARTVNFLQSIQPNTLKQSGSMVMRIKEARLGRWYKKMNTGRKVFTRYYLGQVIMNRQFAKDFLVQTSQAIVDTLQANLDFVDLLYIERLWGDRQLEELAEAETWNVVGMYLGFIGIIDITGITDLTNAYLKPVCAEIFGFPFCKKADCGSGGGAGTNSFEFIPNDPPEAVCQDVQAHATIESNCAAEVYATSVDNGSSDPNRDHIVLSFDSAGLAAKSFSIEGSPHYSVELIVTDSLGESDSCTSTISVSDITPSSIACPVGISQNNALGKCSATVTYENPVVTNNCESISTTEQIEGGASGSEFEVGTTRVAFRNTDSLGNVNECSFNVAVFDAEPPQLSCEGLDATVPTDPGICTATHAYVQPVATDNCEASTVLTQSPSIDPYLFPLGASAVAYTATDLEGNSASCTFNVVVEDRELPEIVCPATINQGTDDGVCTAVVSFPDQVPIGTDNCPDSITVQTSELGSGSTFPIDETTVSYLVTDTSSNSASCSFTVHIFDDEIPVGGCIPGVNPAGNKPAANNHDGFFQITGTDNCEIEKPGLKAYVVDSGSGTRFPTAASGLEFYELGTTFKYTSSRTGRIQERAFPGKVNWKLAGNGDAYVLIEDEAGNISVPAYCVRFPTTRLRNRQ